jgi:hypothetical protein
MKTIVAALAAFGVFQGNDMSPDLFDSRVEVTAESVYEMDPASRKILYESAKLHVTIEEPSDCRTSRCWSPLTPVKGEVGTICDPELVATDTCNAEVLAISATAEVRGMVRSSNGKLYFDWESPKEARKLDDSEFQLVLETGAI